MVKILDFWATWCVDPKTQILMANGQTKLARDIKVSDSVVSVDLTNYERRDQEVQRVRVTEPKPCYRLTLETGRSLISDESHLIFTKGGWKKTSEIELGNFVLVDPVADEVSDKAKRGIILVETKNSFADKRLRDLDLLPLKHNHPLLPIISRLAGALITDGYLYEDKENRICESHFCLGTERDVTWLTSDLQRLGFTKFEVRKQKKDRSIEDRKFTINCFRVRVFDHALFYYFKSLGMPVGRKKSQSYKIPPWLMESQKSIKKEFISGWLGGDGPKVSARLVSRGRPRHAYTVIGVNPIEFHKEQSLENSGIVYARQLSKMFGELGIKVDGVYSENDSDGVVILIKINNSYENAKRLTQIGYAYSTTKNNEAKLVGEFLRYRLYQRDRYIQRREEVLLLSRQNNSVSSIASRVGISSESVVNIRFKDRHGLDWGLPQTGESRHSKWLANRTVNSGLLYEEVVDIKEVKEKKTIGIGISDPHTLVTNGVVSHNCGPCKMMAPIVEELEKELSGKVEFVKINVDEDIAIAQKYGVLSIPTYLVLKDDKEVGRTVGGRSKEAFKTWIESHL